MDDFNNLINEKADPCDDFYGYVCPNPTLENSVMHRDDMKIRVKNTDRVTTGNATGDSAAVQKYYDFYNRCTAVFSEFDQTVRGFVHDIDGLFRDNQGVLYQKVDATQLANILAYLTVNHDTKIISSLKKQSLPQKDENFKRTLLIEIPDMMQITRLYYDPEFPNYVSLQRSQLRTAYAYVDSTIQGSELNKVVLQLFEIDAKIAKALNESGILATIKNLRLMTVNEAMEALPELDWRTYVTMLASYSNANLLKGTKLGDYPLIFDNPKITKSLINVLAQTPPELLNKYLKTKAVQAILDNNNCANLTMFAFRLVKQHLYITDLYPMASDRVNLKASVTKMVNNLITSVRDMGDQISWIKNDTQTHAGFTEKLDKLKKVVGYEDGLDDTNWLDAKYADFTISGNETLRSLFLKAYKFSAKNLLEDKIDHEIDITTWYDAYDLWTNRISIMLASYGTEIYSPNYVPAINYGGLGSMIGHEIIHAFDTAGINFDSDGYLQPWMSEKSKEHYDSMAQCVIDEYTEFTYNGENGKVYNLDGLQTSGENVADNAGLHAAYNAFMIHPDKSKPFPRPSKLQNITDEQLFFMSFARVWCTPDNETPLKLIDPHALPRYRILGTLRNFKPFRNAFNCPANSKYAPEKHCDVLTPSN
uniref:Peptidase_M13 domain-containing protein n=1 Tax=Panagrellus redivivus TaxID=6233 RepID=A0A7E4URG4_PANRE